MKSKPCLVPAFIAISVLATCLTVQAAAYLGSAYDGFDYTTTDGANNAIDGDLLANNGGTNNLFTPPQVSGSFDEIRLGSSWNQVVIPEPSIPLLSGLGLLGFFVRRRA